MTFGLGYMRKGIKDIYYRNRFTTCLMAEEQLKEEHLEGD